MDKVLRTHNGIYKSFFCLYPSSNRFTIFFNTERFDYIATVVTTSLTIAVLTFQNSGLVTLAL